jgi:hypothetical protein
MDISMPVLSRLSRNQKTDIRESTCNARNEGGGMSFHVPEKFRVKTGRLASDSRYENNGAFMVKVDHGQVLAVIASDQAMPGSDDIPWEHVSVSRSDRCPTWAEMCQIKAIFWDEEDCVIQYHPPKSEYVNNHSFCLHLWRPVGLALPMPPSIMVGDKKLGLL